MPIIRAQVRIPAVSTVSEDTVTNTWHFLIPGDPLGSINNITTALSTFYEAFDTYKSNLQSWTTARVKYYNLSDTEPRVPIGDEALSTISSAPAGNPLPHEVACVVSFAGDYVSGQSQARRRGRVYIGPLNTQAVTTTGLLTSALVTAAAAAADALLTSSTASADWSWVVYSPSGNVSYSVTNGWVDNAPDIQRSRGFKATVRTTFS
jgi:hypothetical protein